MNHKLAKLNFKEQYQSEVVFWDDGSDFVKIFNYARYMSETASGQVEGQLSMTYVECPFWLQALIFGGGKGLAAMWKVAIWKSV